MNNNELNEQQIIATEHLDGPLLVLAGAGSGKTRVVTHRIAYLIEKGVLPSDILAVTFTNKAADEMRRRIQQMTKASILSCTFHSFGARFLREFIESIHFQSDFNIYDEEDSLNLLKNSLQSLNIKDEKGLSKKIKLFISSAKNDLLSPKDITVSNFTSHEEKIFIKIYPLYQAKLKEYNAVDFDDLLYLPVMILKKDETIRNIIQERYQFVLIDEYQDTNMAQYLLMKLIVGKHKNIFAVGDPDQSIYSWRGARFQNILNFDEDFPNAKIIKLEHNYRSTSNILDASNALIQHNEKRYEKNLWSQLNEGQKLGYFLAPNEKTEAAFIIEKILEHKLKDKISLEDMVIFYRTNAQSRIFEDELLLRKIPYKIYGGISFYQRKEIKDILAFLRIVLSDSDFISFARTINIPKKGIGLVTLKKLLQHAENKNLSILKLCSELSTVTFLFNISKKQKESIQSYLTVIYELRSLVKEKKTLVEVIKRLMTRINYLEHLKENPETFNDRKENLDQFLAKASQWEEENNEGDLFNFLQDLTLSSSLDEKSNEPQLKLMTLHNGKGLEFSTVFLSGLEEDILPHINCKNTLDEIEEERRLCYVGMTRAKKHLYMSGCYFRFIWGASRIMTPSRFLREIPEKYFLKLSTKEETEKEENSFLVGEKVFHRVFGIGTVIKKYLSSSGETFDVHFDDEDVVRSLVAKYAKLVSYTDR